MPAVYMRKKELTIEIGIEMAMIKVLRTCFRKKSSTMTAMSPPAAALRTTSLIEAWMKRD